MSAATDSDDTLGYVALDAHLLAILLSTTPDHVYYKDLESRFIRISDALARWIGLSSPDEAIGKTDADFFGKEHARQALEDEQEIIRTGTPLLNVEERETWEDGHETWVSTSKLPLIDARGAIIGTYGVSRDVTARRCAEEALRKQSELNEHQSLHDALTGLPNRRLFQDRIEQALLAARRDKAKVTILLIDLDRFKEINDMLGHHAGDELLCEVARRMQSTLRASDTVARLGGDEFGILLPRATERGDLLQLAEKIGKAIEAPITLEGLPVTVEGSIGIAAYPDDGEDVATLIQHADVAMYQAKRENQAFAFYDPDRDCYDPIRLTLVGELRRAIEEKELQLYYQPKADLRAGKVTSVEALLRWFHPQRGLIMPDRFIDQAAETGLMRPLTLYVARAALEQCRAWLNEGIELNVSVNVSTRNLLDIEFPDQIHALLEEIGVEPRLLEIEITEGTMLEDPYRTKLALDKLNALGVRLAIDDFGTGYSSLAYLKNLPVHEIKIDRSFVTSMNQNPDDRVIVRSGIALARNLGFQVTAEGVETGDVWEMLKDDGCEQAQGYFLSRPIPAHELTSWLREHESDAPAQADLRRADTAA